MKLGLFNVGVTHNSVNSHCHIKIKPSCGRFEANYPYFACIKPDLHETNFFVRSEFFAANARKICADVEIRKFAANSQRIRCEKVETIPTFSLRIFSPCQINQSEQQLKTADTNPNSEQERNTLSTTNLCRLLT